MTELSKTTFPEISRNFPSSEVILFGSGNIAEKTLRYISHSQVRCIVDNSVSLQGSTFRGINVEDPASTDFNDVLVIICSTAISDICSQLSSLGIDIAKNVRVSPLLNDLIAISDLEGLSLGFYFTSGTAVGASNEFGGGLYHCNVEGEEKELTKIYSGPCYGAVRVKEKIYFVDTDEGVMSFCSKSSDVIKVGELPEAARAHGISFNEERESFFVTCSYRDSVIEFSKDFSTSNELFLTNKFSQTHSPQHHCNDNFSIGNSLYITMFSSTGNWKFDAFDGCIAEFDLKTGQRRSDVIRDLYMPHNVLLIGGSLHVLDSLPGHLRFGNLMVQGTFPAFTRGLAYSDGYYLIGQSKNRNYSRVLGLSNNISVDCGIIIFDPELKVSRTLQFPMAIGEIHSIVV